MTLQSTTQTQPLGEFTDQQATIPQPPLKNDSTPAVPPMNFTTRKKTRTGIANDCKQLVAVVNDVSTSMTGEKARESDQANQALHNELAAPENKNGFILANIHFNHTAKTVVAPELATTAILPPLTTGGGTSFDTALTQTLNMVTEFMSRENPEGWDYLRPIVLFLSDGYSPVSQKNIDALHEVADVIAIAYGADADESTLSCIASDGKVHRVGTNGHEFRAFLAQVGKTLSQKLATAR